MNAHWSIRVTVNTPPAQKVEHYIQEKWKVMGYVKIRSSLKTAQIVVSPGPGAYHYSIPELAVAHERGHVGFVEDWRMNDSLLTMAELNQVPVWELEVDAWLRALEENTVDFLEGTFILDCLYSYAHFHATPEEWAEAAQLIADRCKEPERLMMYEPIKPPPGSEPPGPSIEFVPSDGDDESEQGGDSEGESWDTDQTKAADADRTAVLTSQEAISAAKQGKDALQDYLRNKGLDPSLDNLPPLVTAVLAGGR